jgi:TRAP-type mannitol/chloroaromatic compound transport system permease small subunit
MSDLLLALANAIHRFLEVIAEISGWLLVVLMSVTCFDVVCRKFGVPIPYTKLQELEWHLHAAIFSLWLGYNYVINAHPRVDSYYGSAGMRVRAWIELAGCLLFALPYTFVLVYYGWEWWWIAYNTGEASDSANGLEHRWIIKGVYYIGLWLLLLGIISVVLRLVAHMFGGRTIEQARLNLGSSQLEV